MLSLQIEGEEAQRQAKRHMERERGRREATADMSEDLSEGEKGDTVAEMSFGNDSLKKGMRRISSVDMMENWANTFKEKKLYLVLIRQEQKMLVQLCFKRNPVELYFTICDLVIMILTASLDAVFMA